MQEKFNQTGSATFLCLLILVIALGSATIFIRQVRLDDRILMNHIYGHYCIKVFHHNLNKHIQTMEVLNKVLTNIKYLQLAAWLFPATWTVSTGATKIKTMARGLQWTEVVSFQKKTWLQKHKGCPLPAHGLISPYSKFGVTVSRNQQGLAVIRRAKWNLIYFLTLGRVIKVTYQKQNGALKTYSQALW